MDGHGDDTVKVYADDEYADGEKGPDIKILRNRTSLREDGTPIPDNELPITLTTPTGRQHKLGTDDIVQVFPRDSKGRINPNKSVAFQGVSMPLPKGFSINSPEILADDLLSDIPDDLKQEFKQTYAQATYVDPYDEHEHKTMDQEPHRFGTRDPEKRLLRKFSDALVAFQRRAGERRQSITPSPTDENLLYVQYPIGGRDTNVVTPGGRLLKGQSGDRVHIVRRTALNRYRVIQRTSLGKLAQQEGEGYFAL